MSPGALCALTSDTSPQARRRSLGDLSLAQGTEFTSWACLDPELLLVHPGREPLARAQPVSAQTWWRGPGRTPPLPSSTRNLPLGLFTAGVISELYLPVQSFVHYSIRPLLGAKAFQTLSSS